ncbi:MAG: hypothetical protein ACK5S9_11435, partial [Roseiflexaceae bacterium]
MSHDQHPPQFVRAISVSSHGHGQSGVERPYCIDAPDTVHVGRIISVVSGNAAFSAVVVAVIP